MPQRLYYTLIIKDVFGVCEHAGEDAAEEKATQTGPDKQEDAAGVENEQHQHCDDGAGLHRWSKDSVWSILIAQRAFDLQFNCLYLICNGTWVYYWPYNVEHEQSHRLETVRERDGHQAPDRDGRPKYTGQITCRLMRQWQRGLHTVGVHKPSICSLKGNDAFK